MWDWVARVWLVARQLLEVEWGTWPEVWAREIWASGSGGIMF